MPPVGNEPHNKKSLETRPQQFIDNDLSWWNPWAGLTRGTTLSLAEPTPQIIDRVGKFLNWRQLKNHPIIRKENERDTLAFMHNMSKRIVTILRHSGNLPVNRKGHEIPFSTYGWVKFSTLVESLQLHHGSQLGEAVILSLLYDDGYSEHARKRGNKERFEFLMQSGKNMAPCIYAIRATHGHGKDTGLRLDDVNRLLPESALGGVAALCHATKISKIDNMFRTDLNPSGRLGCMFSLYPHWDPRAHSQQRWKSSECDCVLIFSKREVFNHAGPNGGDLYYNPTGSITIPHRISLRRCLNQIVSVEDAVRYLIYDSEFEDLRVHGVAKDTSEMGDMRNQKPDAALLRRSRTRELDANHFQVRGTGWGPATAWRCENFADEARYRGYEGNVFLCPRCANFVPGGFLICPGCSGIVFFQDPDTSAIFSPIAEELTQAYSDLNRPKFVAAVGASTKHFDAKAIEKLVSHGNQCHTRSDVAMVKAKLKDTITWMCKWHQGAFKCPRSGETGSSVLRDMASKGCCPHIRGEGKCDPWSGRHDDWPELRSCYMDDAEIAVATAAAAVLAQNNYCKDTIDTEWYSRMADTIARQLETVPKRWGMSKEKRQRNVLPSEEYHKIKQQK